MMTQFSFLINYSLKEETANLLMCTLYANKQVSLMCAEKSAKTY